MKSISIAISGLFLFISCTTRTEPASKSVPIVGTWELISGTLIEKNGTTVTDYTRGKRFIKIINDTHFAFLSHDLAKGKDTAAAKFSAGGGRYSLKNSNYTEHLEFCNDRQWEQNDFTFTVTISNDTLVQQGVEKVEGTDINRLNIEKYKRVKE